MPVLLDDAGEARFEDYARQVRRFADRLSPKDPENRFKDKLEQCFVNSSITMDGFGCLAGWLDPFAQQLFSTEHQRLIQELFEEDWALERRAPPDLDLP